MAAILYLIRVIVSCADIFAVAALLYVIYLKVFKKLPYTMDKQLPKAAKETFLRVETKIYLAWSILSFGMMFYQNFAADFVAEELTMMVHVCYVISMSGILWEHIRFRLKLLYENKQSL